jgi:hypothetical protein
MADPRSQSTLAKSGIPSIYAAPVNLRERPVKNVSCPHLVPVTFIHLRIVIVVSRLKRTQVPEPAVNKPKDTEFYLADGHGVVKPNPSFLKEHFFREGRLTESQALFILERATEVLSKEPNLVNVKSPVTSQ